MVERTRLGAGRGGSGGDGAEAAPWLGGVGGMGVDTRASSYQRTKKKAGESFEGHAGIEKFVGNGLFFISLSALKLSGVTKSHITIPFRF